MLNEFCQMSETMKQSGFTFGVSHPYVQDLVSAGWIVKISEDCLSIESFGSERKLWRYFPNNQMTFPAVKIHGPMIPPSALPQAVQDKILLGLKKLVKTDKSTSPETAFDAVAFLCEIAQSGIVTSTDDTLEKFWKEWQGKTHKVNELNLTMEPDNPFMRLVNVLASLGDYSPEKAQAEIRRLITALIAALKEGRVAVQDVWKLFFGKYNTKAKEWVADGDAQLYFDLADQSVQKDTTRKLFLEALLESKESEGAKGAEKKGKSEDPVEVETVCSLTGRTGPLVKDTFPQIQLRPFQQKTALMSMNKDVFCHERYGQIAAAICPVGEETVNDIIESIKIIVDNDLEGKTWRVIDADRKNKRDLLIVYYSAQPTCDLTLAQDFDGGEDNLDDDNLDEDDLDAANEDDLDAANEDDEDYDEEDEIQTDPNWEKRNTFLFKTVKVLGTLQGIERENQDNRIVCLILREIDPGRRQTLYADSFTISELDQSAQEWSKGVRNVPDFRMRLPPKEKGGLAVEGRVKTISFKTAQSLYVKQWIRGGLESVDIQGVSRSDIFSLFLNRPNSRYTPQAMLRLLIKNTEELFSAVGNNLHGSRDRELPYNGKRIVLDGIALMGILLNKLQSKKEEYMKDASYNLGRLLSLADSLHVFYCQDVRGGDIPLGLIGNVHLPIMKSSPSSALARLQDRMRIYLAWAKKYQFKPEKPDASDDSKTVKKPAPRLVGWLLNEFGRVSQAIAESGELPADKLTDAQSAQMLLGYLASFKKPSSDEQGAPSVPNEKQIDSRKKNKID